MIKEAIENHRSFNVIHLETMFKVDLFILKPDDASQGEMARREPFQLSPDTKDLLYLASPEDIILNKLQWYRLGGCVSDRQWNDVLGVIKVQYPKLNLPYFHAEAQQRGVEDLLMKIIEEAQSHRVKICPT
jgi:hypothetical protein